MNEVVASGTEIIKGDVESFLSWLKQHPDILERMKGARRVGIAFEWDEENGTLFGPEFMSEQTRTLFLEALLSFTQDMERVLGVAMRLELKKEGEKEGGEPRMDTNEHE